MKETVLATELTALAELFLLTAGAKTPWGEADFSYEVKRGVVWYSTPRHGGLYVSSGVARSELPQKARYRSEKWKGDYWFEEDVDVAIAFFEQPEWEKIIGKAVGIHPTGKKYNRRIIERHYPHYFEPDYIEESVNEPPPMKELKIGDELRFQKLSIDGAYIVDRKGSKWIISTDRPDLDGKRYTLSKKVYEKNTRRILRKNRVIWERTSGVG